MNRSLLTAMNENRIRIRRSDTTLFDYRKITLTTNKGVSNILEEDSKTSNGTIHYRPRVLIDKLAPNEALMVFQRVSYPGSEEILEPEGYLSQKNHGTATVNWAASGEVIGISGQIGNLQDLPVHDLTSVIIHVPYNIRLGSRRAGGTLDRDRLNGLADKEIVTRAARVGRPPTLKFGSVQGVTPRAMITLDSADSRDINQRGHLDTFLDLPSMITGIPRDASQHGGENKGTRRFSQEYLVVLRFSENV